MHDATTMLQGKSIQLPAGAESGRMRYSSKPVQGLPILPMGVTGNRTKMR